jgi:hypothetical protein
VDGFVVHDSEFHADLSGRLLLIQARHAATIAGQTPFLLKSQQESGLVGVLPKWVRVKRPCIKSR